MGTEEVEEAEVMAGVVEAEVEVTVERGKWWWR